MSNLNEYIEKRGITQEQMDAARAQTQAILDAYNLRQARKAAQMTQVQVAKAMHVSQNRVSRIENGEIGAMSLDSIRRYIEAIGGTLTLVVNLPTGPVSLT